MRRRFLYLSIANWIVAIVMWSISAYLGIARPTSIFVYTILFVVGLFAVVVAIATFLLWRHGEEPAAAEPAAGEPPAEEVAGEDEVTGELAEAPITATKAPEPAADEAESAAPAKSRPRPETS